MLLLVQLGLRERVVQIVDGHLVEGNHVLELLQLEERKVDQQREENYMSLNSGRWINREKRTTCL